MLYNSYNVLNFGEQYQINFSDERVRECFKIYKRRHNMIYCEPPSHRQRLEFEKEIINSGIDERDTVETAIEKYKKQLDRPKRGYTSEDIRKLKEKILGA